jgi:hypothetical protein
MSPGLAMTVFFSIVCAATPSALMPRSKPSGIVVVDKRWQAFGAPYRAAQGRSCNEHFTVRRRLKIFVVRKTSQSLLAQSSHCIQISDPVFFRRHFEQETQ